jgi:hypothetical protein
MHYVICSWCNNLKNHIVKSWVYIYFGISLKITNDNGKSTNLLVTQITKLIVVVMVNGD